MRTIASRSRSLFAVCAIADCGRCARVGSSQVRPAGLDGSPAASHRLLVGPAAHRAVPFGAHGRRSVGQRPASHPGQVQINQVSSVIIMIEKFTGYSFEPFLVCVCVWLDSWKCPTWWPNSRSTRKFSSEQSMWSAEMSITIRTTTTQRSTISTDINNNNSSRSRQTRELSHERHPEQTT